MHFSLNEKKHPQIHMIFTIKFIRMKIIIIRDFNPLNIQKQFVVCVDLCFWKAFVYLRTKRIHICCGIKFVNQNDLCCCKRRKKMCKEKIWNVDMNNHLMVGSPIRQLTGYVKCVRIKQTITMNNHCIFSNLFLL